MERSLTCLLIFFNGAPLDSTTSYNNPTELLCCSSRDTSLRAYHLGRRHVVRLIFVFHYFFIFIFLIPNRKSPLALYSPLICGCLMLIRVLIQVSGRYDLRSANGFFTLWWRDGSGDVQEYNTRKCGFSGRTFWGRFRSGQGLCRKTSRA